MYLQTITRKDCKPFSCDRLPRELITAYTCRRGFYSVNPCILSVCTAPTDAFIQSRPNARDDRQKVLRKHYFSAGTRKQSSSITDIAGNAKNSIYSTNNTSNTAYPETPAPRPLAIHNGSGQTQITFFFCWRVDNPTAERRNDPTKDHDHRRALAFRRRHIPAICQSGHSATHTQRKA